MNGKAVAPLRAETDGVLDQLFDLPELVFGVGAWLRRAVRAFFEALVEDDRYGQVFDVAAVLLDAFDRTAQFIVAHHGAGRRPFAPGAGLFEAFLADDRGAFGIDELSLGNRLVEVQRGRNTHDGITGAQHAVEHGLAFFGQVGLERLT